MFDLGNLGLMPFSPKDEDSVRESLKNSDIVINLIGKHYETKHIVPTRRADGKLSRVNYTFDDVHVNIPHKIATLAKEAGVKSFIHLSALSADLESASRWSQSKAKGELAVRDAFPEAIIVKPAKVFGHEDRFLNSTAYWARKLGYFPVLDDGRTLLQPVFASDIGKALMQIVRVRHQSLCSRCKTLTLIVELPRARGQDFPVRRS
jgi:NADH dehydrogenase (ubiquinone) 1 alpha subcomplex subunit 9